MYAYRLVDNSATDTEVYKIVVDFYDAVPIVGKEMKNK